MKAKIAFFGTPEFAVSALRALQAEGYDFSLVITQPDKPVGRKQDLTPSPVKVAAKKLGLKVAEGLTAGELKDCSAEAGIVVAYGEIIPSGILNLFPKGCLNIHPSLLPKYRGPSPIQSAIFKGDEKIGVSIIRLDKKLDHGPVVAVVEEEIRGMNCQQLTEKLAESGARLLIDTLPDYLAGKIKPEDQDDSRATFTKLLKREDGRIDWQKPAEEVMRQIRAYFPWPGSFTEFKGKQVKILKASLGEEIEGEIGKFQNKNGRLVVRCGQESVVIEELQPEGRKPMSATEFINGYL